MEKTAIRRRGIALYFFALDFPKKRICLEDESK